MIYCIPLLLILYGVLFYDLHDVPYNSKKYRKLERFVLLSLVLIPGLSYRIGIDTPTYMLNYENLPTIANLSWEILLNANYEPLWVLFSVICKSISNNFALLHILQCFIVTVCVYYAINNNTTRHFIPLLLWFTVCWIHMYFGALRESLALSLFIVGLTKLLKSGSIGIYLLWCIPAIFFHKFVFIVIIITLASYLFKINKFFAILILALLTIFVLFAYDYMIRLLSEDTGIRVQMYLEQAYTERKVSVIGILSYTIELVLPSIMMLYIYNKYPYDEKNIINLKLILYGVIIIASIAVLVESFRRLYYYMVPFIGISLAQISHDITYNKKLYNRCIKPLRCMVIIFIYTIVMSCYRFYQPTAIEYRSYVNYNAFYFPYHSIFTNEIDPTREVIHRY